MHIPGRHDCLTAWLDLIIIIIAGAFGLGGLLLASQMFPERVTTRPRR